MYVRKSTSPDLTLIVVRSQLQISPARLAKGLHRSSHGLCKGKRCFSRCTKHAMANDSATPLPDRQRLQLKQRIPGLHIRQTCSRSRLYSQSQVNHRRHDWLKELDTPVKISSHNFVSLQDHEHDRMAHKKINRRHWRAGSRAAIFQEPTAKKKSRLDLVETSSWPRVFL